MQQFRRIRWGGVFKAAGLIALGYFYGRPDQLERLARNLNSKTTGSRTVYLTPTTIGTAPELVQIHQQPGQSFTSTSQPSQQGWNDFHDPNGHYSIMVPPHKVKQVTDTSSTMNSIRLGDELYIFGYMADERIQLISHDDKQALMRESLNKGWSSNGAAEQFSVVAQRHFGLNGNPGVEIHLQHRSKPIRMTFRQMIVGNRLYMTGVSSPSPQNEQTFLNSLRLH
jgi:hypothetical protein